MKYRVNFWLTDDLFLYLSARSNNESNIIDHKSLHIMTIVFARQFPGTFDEFRLIIRSWSGYVPLTFCRSWTATNTYWKQLYTFNSFIILKLNVATMHGVYAKVCKSLIIGLFRKTSRHITSNLGLGHVNCETVRHFNGIIRGRPIT